MGSGESTMPTLGSLMEFLELVVLTWATQSSSRATDGCSMGSPFPCLRMRHTRRWMAGRCFRADEESRSAQSPTKVDEANCGLPHASDRAV